MDNPVTVIVDASPRWPYGNTMRNQDAEWEEKQTALIQERLHNLISYLISPEIGIACNCQNKANKKVTIRVQKVRDSPRSWSIAPKRRKWERSMA